MNDKLVIIQSELKAPKGQTNSFGNYKYRSCEDILEAVKPLLKEHGLSLILTDEVINVGMSNYVKATAMLIDKEDKKIGVSALAREAETKKGMDDAQITGAASSYARKYALNGLFAIDDTKDADTQDNTKTVKAPVKKAEPDAPTNNDLKALREAMDELGVPAEENADFFQDAIGKNRPTTKEEFATATEYALTKVADNKEAAERSKNAS